MGRMLRVAFSVTAAVLACAACGSGARVSTPAPHAPQRPWLWQCSGIHLDQARDECYIRLLLEDIDRSGDPARELPRIDGRANSFR